MEEKTLDNEERVNESTEITVELPETEQTDLNQSCIVDTSLENEEVESETVEGEEDKSIVTETTTAKEIDDHQRELLVKKAKESDIDWETVEFEDYCDLTPKIDKENLEVFIAVSQDFIDRDTIELYVDMARTEIAAYKELRDQYDPELNPDYEEPSIEDLKYYESVTKSKDEGRMVLASIQIEGRNLAKEFTESKIAEAVIKSVTLNGLKDFIVDKFRLSTSWIGEETDRSKEIQDNLLHNMYVTPIFEEYILRDQYKHGYAYDKTKIENNAFSPKYFNQKVRTYIQAIQIYIRNLSEEQQKNLDIRQIVNRDFKVMEFFRIYISYIFKEFCKDSDGNFISEYDFFRDVNFTEEDMETFNTIVNPIGIYDKDFKELFNIYKLYIEQLSVIDNVRKIMLLAEMNFKQDPLYKSIEDLDYTDHATFVEAITKMFPAEIETTKMGEWSKHYIFLQKYERFYMFYKLLDVLRDKSVDEKGKRFTVFNISTNILSDQYMFLYTEMVSDLNDFIKSNMYSRESRTVLFSSIMNSLIMQHELGFKTVLTEENSTGDGVYELAKERFGPQYEYIVGDKSDDILLSKVNLVDVRRNYINILMNLIEFLRHGFMDLSLRTDEEIVKEFTYKPPVKKQSKKNLSRKDRKRK